MNGQDHARPWVHEMQVLHRTFSCLPGFHSGTFDRDLLEGVSSFRAAHSVCFHFIRLSLKSFSLARALILSRHSNLALLNLKYWCSGFLFEDTGGTRFRNQQLVSQNEVFGLIQFFVMRTIIVVTVIQWQRHD